MNDKNFEPYQLLEQALSNGEFLQFLKGEGGYYFPNKWLETPTDLDTIFLRAFNVYISVTGTNRYLNEELNRGLILLLNDPIGLWWCIFILHNYYFGYKDNALKFEINTNELMPKINDSIIKYKGELFGNKSYVGWRFENGLWENLVQLIDKINDRLSSQGLKIDRF